MFGDMNIYKKMGQKAKKAYQNWVTKQPYHILREYEQTLLDNFSKDDVSNETEDDWGERRSRLEENSEGREVSQNEIIFMTGYLACQEEKEEEERGKELAKQQTGLSPDDRPGTSAALGEGKLLKEGEHANEQSGSSARADGRAAVSFAPILMSSTPKN